MVGRQGFKLAKAFCPDGHGLASADGTWFFRAPQPPGPGAIRLWDADTGRFLRSFVGHRAGVAGLLAPAERCPQVVVLAFRSGELKQLAIRP